MLRRALAQSFFTMDSCLPLLWTNWTPLKSRVKIMLPIFLTPLKILLILGYCDQACHQTLHPPPLLPFQRVVGASQLLLDLLQILLGCLWPTVYPAAGVDAVHQENLEVFLLCKEGFIFRIRWSMADARDSFLWPCLSSRPVYSLLACQ